MQREAVQVSRRDNHQAVCRFGRRFGVTVIRSASDRAVPPGHHLGDGGHESYGEEAEHLFNERTVGSGFGKYTGGPISHLWFGKLRGGDVSSRWHRTVLARDPDDCGVRLQRIEDDDRGSGRHRFDDIAKACGRDKPLCLGEDWVTAKNPLL